MSMDFKINVTLSADENLTALGYTLVNMVLYPHAAEKQLNDVKKEVLGQKEELKWEHQEKPEKETVEEVAKEEKAPAPTISPEKLRASFTAVVKAGKRDEAKALLDEFEVERVSSLAPEQFDSFYERLEAL